MSGSCAAALKAFYDDQMTHHAAALTYYALMSLFPAVLLALSLLRPASASTRRPTTRSCGYLDATSLPSSLVEPLDSSLRSAFQAKGTAATTAASISVGLALYGTTGVLEAARRALNVVFDVADGRSASCAARPVDVGSTVVPDDADPRLPRAGLRRRRPRARTCSAILGLGEGVSRLWNLLRWPAAVLVAMGVFSFIYYVTPDIRHRRFTGSRRARSSPCCSGSRRPTALSLYLSRVADVGAIYGAFASPIVLVGWLWLTDVALLFGAELNAEIERSKELAEGVPLRRHPQPPGASRLGGRRFNK